MPDKQEPKKSETIEIRLSHEAKQAFIRRCRDDDVSASEAIRTMIDERIADVRRRNSRWRALLAVAGGMLLGAGITAPVLAHASPTDQAMFNQLDHNHDGLLSYSEFRGR